MAHATENSRVEHFHRAVQPNSLTQVQMNYQLDQALVFNPLKEAIFAITDDHRGQVSVAAIDLQTNERFHINGENLHLAGSVIKIYIGLSAWRFVQEGLLSLQTVDKLLTEVFIDQSNFAAEILARMVGFDAINKEIQRYGAHYSVLTHHPGYTTEQAPGYVANSNLMTALDSTDTLAALWNGQVLNLNASREFLNRMDSTLANFGITGGLPAGTLVNRKIGWVIPTDSDPLWLNADAVNDVAIVQFDRDGETRAYAISIFMQHNSNQAEAWHLIKDISQLVWEFFTKERYPIEKAAESGA